MTKNKFSASGRATTPVGKLPADAERPALAVDLVILSIQSNELCALIIKRGVAPEMGKWALPGGFVKPDEDLEEAAWRELYEETGVAADFIGHLEQLATYGAVNRDPRGRVVSVAYLAMVKELPSPSAGGDAAHAEIIAIRDALAGKHKLAFDHKQILLAGIERARAKLEYTPLAASFCAEPFTIQQLRHVYEAVWGSSLDPSNFHRKVTRTEGFVQPTDEVRSGESGRPAQLYRKGNATFLYPPLLRGGS